MRARVRSVNGVAALVLGAVASAFADPPPAAVDPPIVPEWLAHLSPAPGSSEAAAFAETRRKQIKIERELKQIRFKHFLTRNAETRQVGIAKIREYTDSAAFPILLSVFEHEDTDVRSAIFEHLMDQRTDKADATLAWAAVFGADDWVRNAAHDRLLSRLRGSRELSGRISTILLAGLRDPGDTPPAAAARLANDLDVFSIIPSIINAQVGGGAGGGGSGGSLAGTGGAIATILIGRQVAFVSDLTPVVGDNAVAFDPTLSVATEGTYINVYGAVVMTYRTEVHQTLVAMADRAWDGRSTAGLGYNLKAWNEWYARQFVPYRATQAALTTVPGPAAP